MGLSTLVVHLKSNYGQLQSGLKTSAGLVSSFASKATGSVNGLGAGILKLRGPLQSIERSVISVGTSLSNLAGKALTGLAAGLLAAGAAGVAWGVKLAADAETAQTSFATMLGDANAAKQVLGDLQAFSAATPFQLDELRDGAKLLLNAQVPTKDLIARMTMLGDIAAGTGKPIGEFASIFAKVKATGKVSLETLNQLAERGVPIYSTLADTMGVSREQMLSMISKGKVGFTDLDKALRKTTDTGGIFAGGMAAQSNTLSGLWSTLKDNVGFAMMELSQSIMDAFDFKGLVNRAISFAQSAKETFASLRPIITQVATTAMAYWGMLWDVAKGVFSAISGAVGMTAGTIGELIVTALAIAEYSFTNWQQVGTLAIKGVQLGIVAFIADVQYFFSDVLPGLLTWFAENWQDVFFTVFDYTSTIFINLGTNIRNAMTAIWDFIKSGGTAELNLAWTPLTEGFVSTLKSLPEIAPRAIGPLEKALQSEYDSLKQQTGDGLNAHLAGRLKELDDFKRQAEEAANANASITAAGTGPEEGADEGTKKEIEVKVAGALQQGSAEAYDQILKSMSQNKEAAIAAQMQKRQAELAAEQLRVQQETLAAIQGQQTLEVVGSL